METESSWAGYCDGFRGDTYDNTGYNNEEYDAGYSRGILNRDVVDTTNADNSVFYEEYCIPQTEES